jgi:integrase
MPRLKFTDRFLRTVPLPTDGQRHEYVDTLVRQLMLRVSSNGNKSFALLACFPGYSYPTRRLLGAYYDGDPRVLDEPDDGLFDRDGAALSLAEARDKARMWLGMIARGRDPGAERKAAITSTKAKQAAARHAARSAFERVAAAWVRRLSGLRTELEIERMVENEFVARWKGRPLASISRDEYRQAIREIAERAPFQAYNALGHLRRLLDWASECGEFSGFISPLKDIKPSSWIDAKKDPRTRILNADELRRVWQAAVTMGYPWGSIVEMLALTGQRLREIADLSWPEIDLPGKLITIPAERMKGKAAHEVPVAPYALALLQSLPRFPGKYVFTLNGGVRSVAGFDRPKRRLDALSGVTGARLHDLRRTARSGFSALAGFEDVHREAVLDHRRSGIARTYDLHKYREQKAALLAAWEQHLLAIVEPEKLLSTGCKVISRPAAGNMMEAAE